MILPLFITYKQGFRMSNEIKQAILSHQLEHGVYDNASPAFAEELARKSTDTGYASLSSAQQSVLAPFLTQICCGVVNPGGHHNDCNRVLTEQILLDAYRESDDSESIQCENCIQESVGYAEHWERFNRE